MLSSQGSDSSPSRTGMCLAAETPALRVSLSPRRSPSPARACQVLGSVHVKRASTCEPSPRHVKPSSPLPPGPSKDGRLPLWQASATLHQLFALAAELNEAWCTCGADGAARLVDTEAIAAAAIAELRPRLDRWKRRRQELEAECEMILARVQAGIDELGGEFSQTLQEACSIPLHARAAALSELSIDVEARLGVARQLQSERSRLLKLLGRESADVRGTPVAVLQTEVAALGQEVTQLEAHCNALTDQVQSAVDELGGEFAEELAEVLRQPLHAQPPALEKLVKDAEARLALARDLRTERLRLLQVLGRQPEDTIGTGVPALQEEVCRLQQEVADLEARCAEIRTVLQTGVEELGGEFADALQEAEQVVLCKRLDAFQSLLTQIDAQLVVSEQLRSERRRLLELIGRPVTEVNGKRVAALQVDVAKLDQEAAALADRCEQLQAQIQAGIDELGGDFAEALQTITVAPGGLEARATLLDELLGDITARLELARKMREDRLQLLALLGRPATDVSGASIESLREEISTLEAEVEQLRARCDELEASVRVGIEQLGGEFANDLSQLSAKQLHERVPALEALLDIVLARRRLQDELWAERGRILKVFGRSEVDRKVDATLTNTVPALQVEVAALGEELELRRSSASQLVGNICALLDGMCEEPLQGPDALIVNAARAIFWVPEPFGVSDGDHKILIDRLAFWEAERSRRQSARQAACQVRALWEELGEEPDNIQDAVVLELLSDSAGNGRGAGWPPEEMLAQLEERRSAWEQRRQEAMAEASRLHSALRSFGGEALAAQVISEHGGVCRSDRHACRERLRELQAALREAERPERERLQHIYEVAGMDKSELENFFASLEEEESLEARRQRLADELRRVEEYFASISGILAKLEELKALVVEGARFEAAKAAEKDRFSGNSLHFLEEEKFRKLFVRKYPNLRDSLITTISSWEEAHQASFVYHGTAVRERLLAMRGAEADLLKVPGDLGLVGMLLQMLDVGDIAVVSKPSRRPERQPRDKSPNSRRDPERPPRDKSPNSRSDRSPQPPTRPYPTRPSPPASASSAGSGHGRSGVGSKQSAQGGASQRGAPASRGVGGIRTPTPPKRTLSVPGGAA